jgi:hypothetical protein
MNRYLVFIFIILITLSSYASDTKVVQEEETNLCAGELNMKDLRSTVTYQYLQYAYQMGLLGYMIWSLKDEGILSGALTLAGTLGYGVCVSPIYSKLRHLLPCFSSKLPKKIGIENHELLGAIFFFEEHLGVRLLGSFIDVTCKTISDICTLPGVFAAECMAYSNQTIAEATCLDYRPECDEVNLSASIVFKKTAQDIIKRYWTAKQAGKSVGIVWGEVHNAGDGTIEAD